MDDTVQIYSTPDNYQRFQFDTFEFIAEQTTTVYLHCGVHLCHLSEDADDCDRSCDTMVKRDIGNIVNDAKTITKYAYYI